jgi:hypothetical protein
MNNDAETAVYMGGIDLRDAPIAPDSNKDDSSEKHLVRRRRCRRPGDRLYCVGRGIRFCAIARRASVSRQWPSRAPGPQCAQRHRRQQSLEWADQGRRKNVAQRSWSMDRVAQPRPSESMTRSPDRRPRHHVEGRLPDTPTPAWRQPDAVLHNIGVRDRSAASLGQSPG